MQSSPSPNFRNVSHRMAFRLLQSDDAKRNGNALKASVVCSQTVLHQKRPSISAIEGKTGMSMEI